MAKAAKKTAKEASSLFHNIMAASVKGNPKTPTPSHYSLPVEQIDLPTKVKMILMDNGVTTLKQLANCHPEDLVRLKNFGVKSVTAVEKALSKYGLRLSEYLP